MKTKKAIHVVINDFRPDYRVLKEANSIAETGCDTTIFALYKEGFPILEQINKVKVRRFNIVTRRLGKNRFILSLKYLECLVRMTWSGIKEKPDIVHAHDLSGLLIGYLIAFFVNSNLIYDSHEFFSQSRHVEYHMPLIINIAKRIEKNIACKADAIITVSNGIARELSKVLNIRRPIVIRNVPERSVAPSMLNLRQILRIPADATILIYIGAILPGRGVETFLRAFNNLELQNVYLVFLGSEYMPNWLNVQLSDDVKHRVKFLPPVHPKDVVPIARQADIGLHAIHGSYINHQLCLPNKLFEYIQAGLAVLVTDLPEMATIVRSYVVGRVFRDRDVDHLEKTMRKMVENKNMLKKWRMASKVAAKELVWEKEKHKLLKLYFKLVENV